MAITMVFMGHGITLLHPLRVGVDLFFVLSGFLIGRIYLRGVAGENFSAFKFWESRWLRTIPPYLVALGFAALANIHFQNSRIHLYYLLFLQNYLGIDGFTISWSLCVEEHFYLALPLIGYVILRVWGRRSLLWLLPVFALFPELFRLFDLYTNRLPTSWFFETHLHCEALILGVWLAYVFLDHPVLWRKLLMPAAFLAVIPLAMILMEEQGVVLTPLLAISLNALSALGYAGWLRWLYEVRWEPVAAAPRFLKSTVQGIALASYSIYLLHITLFPDIRALIDNWPRGPIRTATIMGGTLIISVLFYFLVEHPSIQFRDWYLKRRAAEAPRVPTVVSADPAA